MGMLTVLGFSVGLALTLVGVGVAIVLSLNAIGRTHRLIWVSRFAPVVSAGVVLLSGTVALLIAQFGH